MRVYMRNLWKDTQGQDLVEYALLAGLVAVAAIAVLPNLGAAVNGIFTKITDTLNTPPAGQ